jgi:hypothetical protein
MDLEEAARLIAERINGKDSVDVGVKVEIVPAGWLDVHVHSRNPITWFHAGVDLHADGRVTLPPSDDGCTPIGTPHTLVGAATSVAEAVDLVVTRAEALISSVEQRIDESLKRELPCEQPPVSSDELADACALWQGGRDVGSSLVRGAARALTGIDHYFRADFIAGQERSARAKPDALRAAIALLRGVNAAERRDANGWYEVAGLSGPGFIGRGIESKPQDDQIVKQLKYGHLTMPLWGVSLSREVAEGFGTRFLFEIVGSFPAVPAWLASGIKDEEQELITGGKYRVLSMREDGGTSHVRLQWIGASGDRVGSDDVLLGVLGALPGVWKSEVTRSALVSGEEELTVRLEGYGNWATVSRKPDRDEVEVMRYWEPEPDPNAKDDSPYTEYAAMLKASRRMTAPGDVDSIVAAVLAER